MFSVDSAEDLEGIIDFEGTVRLQDEGVELVGRTGTLLEYPFLASELRQTAIDAEDEWLESVDDE